MIEGEIKLFNLFFTTFNFFESLLRHVLDDLFLFNLKLNAFKGTFFNLFRINENFSRFKCKKIV